MNIPEVVRSVPELRTRPTLLAYMADCRSWGRKILNMIDVMWQILAIHDPKTARHLLDLYYTHCRERLKQHEGRIPTPVFLESSGVLRNVHRNICLELCEETGKSLEGSWGSRDVKRYEEGHLPARPRHQ